jgi:outer membrane protein assembly factor BamB
MRPLKLGLVLFLATQTPLLAENWPQWRGPTGSGISTEKNLPSKWTGTDNVAWKAKLAGLGVSTPVIWGDRIFVTSQVGASARRPGNHPTMVQGGDPAAAGEAPLGGAAGAAKAAGSGPDAVHFVVEAFSRIDGKRLWEHRLEAVDPLNSVHQMHNLASPSPVTDGERVYAWFGNGQTVAIDMNGKAVWTRHLGKEIAPFDINWGHGSSPAVYRDSLILPLMHERTSFLIALDTRTGKERWKIDQGKSKLSYSTPLVFEGPAGPELIVNSSQRVEGYDPRDGKLLWHFGDANKFPIPMPLYHDGVVYFSRGYRSGPYGAIRAGARGDASASSVVWSVATGAPYVSSLVYWDGLLYMANDVGVVTAVDAKTGARVWQERIGGVFAASPIAADGKIFLPSESGDVYVLRAGSKPDLIATNNVGERIVASMAVSGGKLFIRTDGTLFCIGT